MSTFFLQQLINGLTLGSVYGLIAIGYTMVYGIIGMINFAHGEVYMISAYLSAIGLGPAGVFWTPLLSAADPRGRWFSPSWSPAFMAGRLSASPISRYATRRVWHR